MGDDVVTFCKDHVIFAAERIGKSSNKIEQTVAAQFLAPIEIKLTALRAASRGPTASRSTSLSGSAADGDLNGTSDRRSPPSGRAARAGSRRMGGPGSRSTLPSLS